MSSILKALRKLEEEKAALGEGRVDLARDILKRSAPQRNSSSTLALKVMFFTVLLLALVVGIWLMLSSTVPVETIAVTTPADRNPVIVPSPATVETRSKLPVTDLPLERKTTVVKDSVGRVEPVVLSESAPSAPNYNEALRVSSEPVVEVVELKEKVVPALVDEKVKAIDNPTPIHQTTVAVEKVPVVIPAAPVKNDLAVIEESEVNVSDDPAPKSVVGVPALASPPAVPQRLEPSDSPTSLSSDLPELLISAIAFRPKPGERLAVINDLPVMEGTSLEGVQIVEIQEQSVRFSWQGMEFVLPLTEENPAN